MRTRTALIALLCAAGLTHAEGTGGGAIRTGCQKQRGRRGRCARGEGRLWRGRSTLRHFPLSLRRGDGCQTGRPDPGRVQGHVRRRGQGGVEQRPTAPDSGFCRNSADPAPCRAAVFTGDAWTPTAAPPAFAPVDDRLEKRGVTYEKNRDFAAVR